MTVIAKQSLYLISQALSLYLLHPTERVRGRVMLGRHLAARQGQTPQLLTAISSAFREHYYVILQSTCTVSILFKLR